MQDKSNAIELLDSIVGTCAVEKTLEAEEMVVDDLSLLKAKPVAMPGHSNVLPCTWKMIIFSRRNKS